MRQIVAGSVQCAQYLERSIRPSRRDASHDSVFPSCELRELGRVAIGDSFRTVKVTDVNP